MEISEQEDCGRAVEVICREDGWDASADATHCAVPMDCAVRCISGGIPAVFATNDFNGSPAILLLTDLHQKPLPKETFLKLVAQPVRIHGSVVKTGETLYLKTGPSAISPLP